MTSKWRAQCLRVSVVATIVVIAGCAGAAPRRTDLEASASAMTFTRDVAPILYRNCTTCHRPDGIAPMSLFDYENAQRSAEKIRDAVSSGQMPPWHAAGPRGSFSNDRRLTDDEKSTIVQWVDAGAPRGDPKDLPPRPEYTTAWNIGAPDAVVAMPTEYHVPATGVIEYQYFEAPTNFTEDKWVQAIEVQPDARTVVHHVLVFARAPSAPRPPVARATPAGPPPQPLLIRREDHNIPDTPPGPDGQPRELGALIGTTAPGTNVLRFPEGTALRVRSGSVLTFQMHYTTHGHEDTDRTKVGMVFAKSPPDEQVLASSFQNGQFTIPAGATDYRVPSEVGFREAVRVWGLFPHTHVRGTRWEYRLVQPGGRSDVILSVPEYDFNWQTYYMFAKPLEVPAGGRIEATAWYDNSAARSSNPDPTKAVRWGDQTWEEMQYTGLLFTVNSRRLSAARPR